METLQLKANKRDVQGKKVAALRRSGILPAIVYGKETEAKSIQLDAREFKKVYRSSGESSLIDLDIDGEALKVLVSDIQANPVTGDVIHVDLHKVNLTEEITANVPLEFKNEEVAPAVKELGGVLVKEKDEIEVECLPANIPHEISVDVTSLATFEDIIHVSDLKIPENVKILNDLEDVICLVKPPRSEEELESLNEEVVEDVEKVEKVEENKDQESEEGSEA